MCRTAVQFIKPAAAGVLVEYIYILRVSTVNNIPLFPVSDDFVYDIGLIIFQPVDKSLCPLVKILRVLEKARYGKNFFDFHAVPLFPVNTFDAPEIRYAG